jgi:hypothetical protein
MRNGDLRSSSGFTTSSIASEEQAAETSPHIAASAIALPIFVTSPMVL